MAQTTQQFAGSLRFGSARVSIGDDAGSLVDIGCLRGLSFNSKVENSEVEFDNCPSITKYSKGDRGSFSLSLAEVDFTTLSKMDDGLINLTLVAGTPVAVVDETHAIVDTTATVLDNKNGDNTVVTAVTVTDVGGVTTYVENTDYVLDVNADGFTTITMIPGGAIVSGQDIEVDYTYTPNAAKEITFNTTGQKIGKYVRIVNTNSAGATLTLDIDDATNITPIVMPFISDNEDDVMTVDVELEGTIVKFTDEQSV